MTKQQFNPEEYGKLKHRVEALKKRIRLDSGPEQETAKRLLSKIEKKLEIYEKTHEMPKQSFDDYSTTSNFFDNEFVHKSSTSQMNSQEWEPKTNFKWYTNFQESYYYEEDNRSEDEKIKDLGILYAILGSTYQTTLNYHIFKIRFKKQTDKGYAFYRVYADIYEDNIRICKDVIIGFWPFRMGDDRCGDMEFASRDNTLIDKYDNGCCLLYKKLIDELMDIWNHYFDEQQDVPRLTTHVAGYLENHSKKGMKVLLNYKERKEIIDRTEEEIDSGKTQHLISAISRRYSIPIMAYKPYYVLSQFLEESGVVYEVETSGVYIWDSDKKRYRKLVGYEFIQHIHTYKLYVI